MLSLALSFLGDEIVKLEKPIGSWNATPALEEQGVTEVALQSDRAPVH